MCQVSLLGQRGLGRQPAHLGQVESPAGVVGVSLLRGGKGDSPCPAGVVGVGVGEPFAQQLLGSLEQLRPAEEPAPRELGVEPVAAVGAVKRSQVGEAQAPGRVAPVPVGGRVRRRPGADRRRRAQPLAGRNRRR